MSGVTESQRQRLEELDQTLWSDRNVQISSSDMDLIRLELELHEQAMYHAPCSRQTIARIIDLFAEVFHADTPSAEALTQWFSMIQIYPESAVKAGARRLLRTHRYPNLPLPADFIASIEESAEWRRMTIRYEQLGLKLRRAERLHQKNLHPEG